MGSLRPFSRPSAAATSMWNQLNGSEQRPGWVRTQTPDSGAWCLGLVLCRRGRELLALSWPSYKPEVHIGTGDQRPHSQPQPAAALRSPVMERPRNHTAQVPALTTTLIDYLAFFWITVKCLSPGLHFVVTSPPVIFRYDWLCSHGPPLCWLARTRLNGPTVLAPTNRCYAQSEPGTAAPLLLHPAPDLRTRLATAQPSNNRKHNFKSTRDSTQNVWCISKAFCI